MCQRVQCSKCGKPGFAGCGMHVEQVLSDVQPEKRCQCNNESKKETKERKPLLKRIFR